MLATRPRNQVPARFRVQHLRVPCGNHCKWRGFSAPFTICLPPPTGLAFIFLEQDSRCVKRKRIDLGPNSSHISNFQSTQEDIMGIATSPTIDPRAASFVAKQGKILINGKWVDAASGKTFTTYNPANGEPLARIAEGDKEDINRAVAAARKAFDGGPWGKLTPSERGRLIWKLADLLEQNTEEFATLETLDNGKPLNVARAADVPLAVDCFRYYAGWTTKIEGNTLPISVPYAKGAKFLAYTTRNPVGVVGQIIPWNFPLLMAAWKLAPALATGCTIVLKP